MQTLLIFSNILASTQSIFNKGLNMPKQDIPNISLEFSNILFLITDLSP